MNEGEVFGALVIVSVLSLVLLLYGYAVGKDTGVVRGRVVGYVDGWQQGLTAGLLQKQAEWEEWMKHNRGRMVP